MTTARRQTDAVVRAYRDAARRQDHHLAAALTRTKSSTGREILAGLVRPGASASVLESWSRSFLRDSGTAGRSTDPAARLDPEWALKYAYVAARQAVKPHDYDVARGLLTAVRDLYGSGALAHRDVVMLLQLSLHARDRAAAHRALEALRPRSGARRLAVVDLTNPWIGSEQAEEVWLDRVNDHVFGDQLAPVGLLSSGETPFDRLTVGSIEKVTHPAKITVIMSCYNPGRHLITAVRSVLDQTWQNIELFLVDDASPRAVGGLLKHVQRLDPRIKVIRKAVNGGTYRARNTALRFATGDFFTCVDSDDWAHPQRLEMSVRPMLADPRLVATRGSGIRATTDLEFSRVGYRWILRAASSLMVRTLPVLNRIGFFHPVRKAADNEYARRIEAAFNGSVIDLVRRPLTVLLADELSLSASDFSPGWRHPSRSEYLEAQRYVHQQITDGRRSAFVDMDDSRFFPAPCRWQRQPQDGGTAAALDLCIVADWRQECVDPCTLDYLRRAVADGLTVGVVHLESVHDMRRTELPVVLALRELIASGAVERIYLDDDRQVTHLVVADPRPFQFPADVTVKMVADHVVATPRKASIIAGEYRRATVTDNLTSMLGLPPVWSSRFIVPVRGSHETVRPFRPVSLVVPDSEPCHADGAEIISWPLREPADGARGARLSLLGASAPQDGVQDISVLMTAWRAGPLEWARAAASWLSARPNTWCVVVQSAATGYLVAREGLRLVQAGPNRSTPVKLVLKAGDVGTQLTTVRASRLRSRLISPQDDFLAR